MVYEKTSLNIRNYKVFGPDWAGFDQICQFNVIVGRNNSGKSALLDILQVATSPNQIPPLHWHKRTKSELVVTTGLTEACLKRAFPEGTSGGHIDGDHWRSVGCYLVGTPIKLLVSESPFQIFSLDDVPRVALQHFVKQFEPEVVLRSMLSSAIAAMHTPFSGKIVRRLAAERNMTQEQANEGVQIDIHGAGATNVIARMITRTRFDGDLIRVTLRDSLNKIFEPDASFKEILPKENDSNSWEIFLEEKYFGTVPLAHSGSGLKTVLIILLLTQIIPKIENRQHSDYVYAFEELENNLHPALQRRLLAYIRDFANSYGVPVFITTHSNVVIDFFSRDADAQIIHVTNNGTSSRSAQVTTYLKHKDVLDDLDVRASDLLQSNCIVWVEGPSDRLYVNRWIDLKTKGKLKEGQHYQCVFYGGRLLSHLSAEGTTNGADGAVRIMQINRHAAMLIDSDKREFNDPLNETKLRLIDELNNMNGFVWVTSGREI